jgi:hypothetical protein
VVVEFIGIQKKQMQFSRRVILNLYNVQRLTMVEQWLFVVLEVIWIEYVPINVGLITEVFYSPLRGGILTFYGN